LIHFTDVCDLVNVDAADRPCSLLSYRVAG
jgi:hypothetical protein